MRNALEEIRRRVWTPLCAPTALLDELGAERLKGVLLYGPPGCGKSYLAKQIREVAVQKTGDGRQTARDHRQIRRVSEGATPEKHKLNLTHRSRGLWCHLGCASPPLMPPRRRAKDAENNELHVVVLDEFDAIARVRSDGKKSDTATRDSVVNQLLVLMDGIATMPVPTFVLALTNRRS